MMPGNLSELKAQTLNDTPGLVKAKVPVETKADTVEEVFAKHWLLRRLKHSSKSSLSREECRYKRAHSGVPLVDRLAHKLLEAEA